MLRPSLRALLRPDRRQRLYRHRDVLKPRLCKRAVQPICEKHPVFRIRAIGCRDETCPYERMRAGFVGIDLGDKLPDALDTFPLILVCGCAVEVDLGGFDEGES